MILFRKMAYRRRGTAIVLTVMMLLSACANVPIDRVSKKAVESVLTS